MKPAVVARRFGMKGPAAEALLRGLGIAVPAAANRIVTWQAASAGNSGRCLRLGSTEFLIEHDGESGSSAPALPDTAGAPGAYLLLRSDFSVVLEGPAWPEALAQACSFDLQRLRDEPDLVVMTLLAGITVTFVREPATADVDQFALRLWCDASYATYLQESLSALLSDSNPFPGGHR